MIGWLAMVVLLGCGGDPRAELERSIDTWVASYELGTAELLVRQCGSVAIAHRAGPEPRGEVVAASTSKWVAAAAILALVDEGRLDLDLPIRTWLPELTDAGGAITVRQLLSHTSGLASRHPCLDSRYEPMRACAVAGAAAPRQPPGAMYRYGNLSYQVAAAVAEQAAGQPWATIVRTRLGEPLGWERTRFGVLPGETNPGVAGSLMTRPDELSRFLQMILDGGTWEGRRVLSEAAIAQLEADQVGDALKPTDGPGMSRRASHPIYGLGVWRYAVDEAGAATVVGASGKFGVTAWIDRPRRIAGVLAVQIRPEIVRSARPHPFEIRDAVRAALPERCPEAGPRPPG